MVVLIRCNDILTDPRATKYVNFMKREGVEYIKIGWDRDGKALNNDDTFYYKKTAGYNVGGLKAVRNRIGWMLFVIKTLIRIKPKDAVLHGCDLDSAFPAVVYKLLFNKKTRVIFDVFDWFSATLYNQKMLVLKAFKMMERVSVKYSDYLIICEPERIEQIPYIIPQEKILVLPNIPYFNSEISLYKNSNYSFNNNRITFAYVGGFSTERCLSEIIDLASEGKINLLIAGYGADSIQEKLDNLKNSPNIKCCGKVKYEDGLQIMYNADVIYAMYSISNPNHIYAAPNKFYECMMLGRPLFTTKGTIVERKVNDLNIGYVSGETKEEIYNTIKDLNPEDMVEKGNIAHGLWQTLFSTYTENFMKDSYLGIISK